MTNEERRQMRMRQIEQFPASVNNRHRLRSGCPVCSGRMAIKGVNDLATTHRKLAKQWDRERNGVRATEVTAHSSTKAW